MSIKLWHVVMMIVLKPTTSIEPKPDCNIPEQPICVQVINQACNQWHQSNQSNAKLTKCLPVHHGYFCF